MLQTAKIATAQGAPDVETYSVDLADADALEAFAKEVLRKHSYVWCARPGLTRQPAEAPDSSRCRGLVLNAGILGIVGPHAIIDSTCAAPTC